MDTDTILVIGLIMACFLFAGSPDLMDAIIHNLMEKNNAAS